MISAVFRRGGDVSFVAHELKAVFDPQGGRWIGGRYVPSLLAAIGEVIETHMRRIGFMTPDDAQDVPASVPIAAVGDDGKPGPFGPRRRRLRRPRRPQLPPLRGPGVHQGKRLLDLPRVRLLALRLARSPPPEHGRRMRCAEIMTFPRQAPQIRLTADRRACGGVAEMPVVKSQSFRTRSPGNSLRGGVDC